MLFPGGNNKKKEKFPDSEVQYSRETRDKRKETGERRWQKGDGRQEVGGRRWEAGSGRQEAGGRTCGKGKQVGPPNLLKCREFPHIFLSHHLTNESFFKFPTQCHS